MLRRGRGDGEGAEYREFMVKDASGLSYLGPLPLCGPHKTITTTTAKLLFPFTSLQVETGPGWNLYCGGKINSAVIAPAAAAAKKGRKIRALSSGNADFFFFSGAEKKQT